MASTEPSALCLTQNQLYGLGIKEALHRHGISQVDHVTKPSRPLRADQYTYIFISHRLPLSLSVKSLIHNCAKRIIVLYEELNAHTLYKFFEIGATRFLSTNADTSGLEFNVKLRDAINSTDTMHIPTELAPLLLNQRKYQLTCELTERELLIVSLLWKGFDNFELSERLNLSVRTIERYRSSILKKTDSKSMVGAVRFCFDKGLMDESLNQRA